MMTTVYVKEIEQDNWQQAIRIDVAPEQRRFVASNLYSIAESKFNPTFVPLAIYDDTETMVGFLMYGIDNGELWILRLMVARAISAPGLWLGRHGGDHPSAQGYAGLPGHLYQLQTRGRRRCQTL
jgi:hypothetical protein